MVELLLLDAGNPRSLRFQLDALAHDLGQPAGGRRSDGRRAVAADARPPWPTGSAARRRLDAGPAGTGRRRVRRSPSSSSTPSTGCPDLARSINLEYIAQVIARSAARPARATSAGRRRGVGPRARHALRRHPPAPATTTTPTWCSPTTAPTCCPAPRRASRSTSAHVARRPATRRPLGHDRSRRQHRHLLLPRAAPPPPGHDRQLRGRARRRRTHARRAGRGARRAAVEAASRGTRPPPA